MALTLPQFAFIALVAARRRRLPALPRALLAVVWRLRAAAAQAAKRQQRRRQLTGDAAHVCARDFAALARHGDREHVMQQFMAACAAAPKPAVVAVRHGKLLLCRYVAANAKLAVYAGGSGRPPAGCVLGPGAACGVWWREQEPLAAVLPPGLCGMLAERAEQPTAEVKEIDGIVWLLARKALKAGTAVTVRTGTGHVAAAAERLRAAGLRVEVGGRAPRAPAAVCVFSAPSTVPGAGRGLFANTAAFTGRRGPHLTLFDPDDCWRGVQISSEPVGGERLARVWARNADALASALHTAGVGWAAAYAFGTGQRVGGGGDELFLVPLDRANVPEVLLANGNQCAEAPAAAGVRVYLVYQAKPERLALEVNLADVYLRLGQGFAQVELFANYATASDGGTASLLRERRPLCLRDVGAGRVPQALVCRQPVEVLPAVPFGPTAVTLHRLLPTEFADALTALAVELGPGWPATWRFLSPWRPPPQAAQPPLPTFEWSRDGVVVLRLVALEPPTPPPLPSPPPQAAGLPTLEEVKRRVVEWIKAANRQPNEIVHHVDGAGRSEYWTPCSAFDHWRRALVAAGAMPPTVGQLGILRKGIGVGDQQPHADTHFRGEQYFVPVCGTCRPAAVFARVRGAPGGWAWRDAKRTPAGGGYTFHSNDVHYGRSDPQSCEIVLYAGTIAPRDDAAIRLGGLGGADLILAARRLEALGAAYETGLNSRWSPTQTPGPWG